MSKKDAWSFKTQISEKLCMSQYFWVVMEKERLERMNVKSANNRIKRLFIQYRTFMKESGIKYLGDWFQIVNELARLREKKGDGFIIYSLSEKVGSKSKNLFKLCQQNKVLFGILVIYMLEYIKKTSGVEKIAMRKVCENLQYSRAWNIEPDGTNYALRNFDKKGMAIYCDRTLMNFLSGYFEIECDSKIIVDESERQKKFIKTWAEMFIYLDDNYLQLKAFF